MNETEKLVKNVIKGIQDKKGSGIVVADLSHIDGTVCKYFIICQGNSPQRWRLLPVPSATTSRRPPVRNRSTVSALTMLYGLPWTMLTSSCTSLCRRRASTTTWSICGRTPSWRPFPTSTDADDRYRQLEKVL